MKYLFIALFIILSSCVTSKYGAHTYPNPFEFTQIDTLNGSKNDLFVKANEWVAKTFISAKEVIQMHDKEAGKIIAKGIIVSNNQIALTTTSAYINYTMTIDVKDGKIRIVLSDFYLTEFTSSGKSEHTMTYNASLSDAEMPRNMYYKDLWNNIKGDAYVRANAMLKDFKENMNKSQNSF